MFVVRIPELRIPELRIPELRSRLPHTCIGVYVVLDRTVSCQLEECLRQWLDAALATPL